MLGGSVQSPDQCVFLRGFHITIHERFYAAFREPGISPVESVRPESIFGSRSTSASFSPSAGGRISGEYGILSSVWSGLQQASTQKNNHSNDVISEPSSPTLQVTQQRRFGCPIASIFFFSIMTEQGLWWRQLAARLNSPILPVLN